jgi:hypothetical protein
LIVTGTRDESRCPKCGISEVRPDGSYCTGCYAPVTKTKPTGDDHSPLVRRIVPEPLKPLTCSAPATTEGRVSIPREGFARRAPARAEPRLNAAAGINPVGTAEEEPDMTDDNYTPCGKPRSEVPAAQWHSIPGEASTCMKYAKHRVEEGKVKTLHRGRLILNLLTDEERAEKLAQRDAKKADRELEAMTGRQQETRDFTKPAAEPDDVAEAPMHPQRAVLTPAKRNSRVMGSGPVSSPVTRPDAPALGDEDDEDEGEDES